MTLLVISDSHGRSDNIDRAVSLNPTSTALLFLGDGQRDLPDRLPNGSPVYSVRGNCDLFFGSSDNLCPEERILRFGEYNIMMMHGHTRYVKSSYLRAAAYAASKDADILLFGHTHERLDKYLPAGYDIGGVILKKPLRIFNPGSIGRPISSGYSFGIVTIREKDCLCSFGTL